MIIFHRSSQCRNCRNFRGIVSGDNEENERFVCRAFPEAGIPAVIVTNEHDHREPFPGDGGIGFEPRDGEPLTL